MDSKTHAAGSQRVPGGLPELPVFWDTRPRRSRSAAGALWFTLWFMIMFSIIFAGQGWWDVVQLHDLISSGKNKVALFLHPIVFCLLGVVSFFSLLAVQQGHHHWVQRSFFLLLVQSVISVAVGIFVIVLVFQQKAIKPSVNCDSPSIALTEDQCKVRRRLGTGPFIIGVYTITWLLQAYLVFLSHQYQKELRQDKMYKWIAKSRSAFLSKAEMV
jgi:hypothetical protein